MAFETLQERNIIALLMMFFILSSSESVVLSQNITTPSTTNIALIGSNELSMIRCYQKINWQVTADIVGKSSFVFPMWSPTFTNYTDINVVVTDLTNNQNLNSSLTSFSLSSSKSLTITIPNSDQVIRYLFKIEYLAIGQNYKSSTNVFQFQAATEYNAYPSIQITYNLKDGFYATSFSSFDAATGSYTVQDRSTIIFTISNVKSYLVSLTFKNNNDYFSQCQTGEDGGVLAGIIVGVLAGVIIIAVIVYLGSLAFCGFVLDIELARTILVMSVFCIACFLRK